MFASLLPRHRLLLASGLILGLAALAHLGEITATGVARGVLGLGVLAGLGAWLWRRGASRPRFSVPERLKVLSRAGLSQRCGVALVEADGRTFLVVFGDAFAEVRVAHSPKRVPAHARRFAVRHWASLPPKGEA